jgi:alpha-glucosidase
LRVKKITVEDFTIFEIDSPNPLVHFSEVSKNGVGKQLPSDKNGLVHDNSERILISKKPGQITVKKELGSNEHILGLGEKAYEIDRRRISVKMWNIDAYGYNWFSDPLYVSIPFFISVQCGNARGFFFNSCSRMTFDIGVAEYDKIVIKIPEPSLRFYIIRGPSIEKVLENYAELTGKPFKYPEWALGHQISRYSYYPQDKVIEIVKQYKRDNLPVSCIYLDIDYMQDMKLFSWDKEKFPDPRSMINELHSMGVKVVANIGPGIKFDRNFQVFKEGLGLYCKTPSGKVYSAPLWAGRSVFPDFFNAKARQFWAKQVKKFVSNSGLDGVWLDMNEPAVFTDSKTFNENVIHKTDAGRKVEHELAHNAYCYFQTLATLEGLDDSPEPFILSRAGFAGIQKYAAIWSGDNTASWENMRLQIPLLLSLSISGIPFVGCDIGGFIGRSDPELLTRYYEMAAFFPLLRNHKDKAGNDQEPFRLPAKYKERVRTAIELRYSLLPYLKNLAQEANQFGHPIIRPLAYDFQDDEDSYSVNHEYMVGKSLLHAPIVEKGQTRRDVYLPPGKWISWKERNNKGKVILGKNWISTSEEMPLYLMFGSILPTDEVIS